MTEHRVKVLVIDGDATFLEEAATELSGQFTVYTSATGENGLKLFAQLRPQVVIVDSGISDIPFTGFLDHLKGLDGAALRIATSQDYSAIEKVVQAIDTGHIHKYCRKPVNYFDLVESINARTVNYQVGRGLMKDADTSPAYEKLHNIVDKAKETEKLRQQLESQMAKIRDAEADSFSKMRDALAEVDSFRKKVADKDALIGSLQAKSLELEELKKRDIDRVERERSAFRQELKELQNEYEKLLPLKDELAHAKSANESLRGEKDKLSDGIGDLRVSVARDRKAMLEEIAQNRRAVEEELAKKKDEAERIVEVQKERNKAELQKVRSDFEEEKRRALQDVASLRAKIDSDRKAKLAEVEEERKRLEGEFNKIKADRKQVEAELAQKKDEAERAIEMQKERNKAELKALQIAFKEEQEHAAWSAMDRLKAELENDRKAKMAEFEAERKAKMAEVEADRRRGEQELARKKEEAEHVVEAQKEKNKVELKALQEAFEEHKQRAAGEIEKLKAEFEAGHKSKLAEIEADRRRVEEELAEIRARMIEEKKQLEKSAQEQREKAEVEIQRVRESAVQEREKLTNELKATLAGMKKAAEEEVKELKANATRDLDILKAASEKREREMNEAIAQAKRLARETEERLQLSEGRIASLESEVEKRTNETDHVLRDLESAKADFGIAVQSRDALLEELADLRSRL